MGAVGRPTTQLCLAALFCFGLAAAPAQAAPAVQLLISDCAPAPPPLIPCPPVILIHELGEPVSFWVSAVDANGLRATDYTGTVSFTSSDGSALLPAPHVFTPGDNSVFLATITFNSPGVLPGAVSGTSLQTVTATDSANQLTGTGGFNLFGAPVAIPTLAPPSLIGLALVLALAGMLALRQRTA